MNLVQFSDLGRLLLLSSGLGLAVGILFMVLARVQPRAQLLRIWSIGVLGLSAGNAGLAMRNVAPDFVSIILSNTLILASLVALHAGAVRLNNGKTAQRADLAGWSVVATGVCLLLWLTYVHPDLNARVMVVCLAAAIVSARTAAQLSAYAQGRGSSFPANMLAGLWWFIVVIVLITALATYENRAHSQNLFEAGPQLLTLFHARPVLLVLIAGFALWTQFHALRTEQEVYLTSRRAEMARSQAAFERVSARALAEDAPLSLALVDIDNYQDLARRHGLPAAESVHEWAGEIVRSRLGEGDTMGSYENNQFAVLLTGADRESAQTLMEEVCRHIRRSRCIVGDRPLSITVSIGIASREPGRATVQAMTAAATVALYQAHAAGYDRVATAPAPAWEIGRLDSAGISGA